MFRNKHKASLILACGGGGGKGADAIGTASTGGGGGGSGAACGTDAAAGSASLSCEAFIQLLSNWICWMKNLLTAPCYKTYIKLLVGLVLGSHCSSLHEKWQAWNHYMLETSTWRLATKITSNNILNITLGGNCSWNIEGLLLRWQHQNSLGLPLDWHGLTELTWIYYIDLYIYKPISCLWRRVDVRPCWRWLLPARRRVVRLLDVCLIIYPWMKISNIYIYHVYIYHVYLILCMNSSSSDVSLGRRRSLSPRNLFLRPMSLSRACISQHTLSIMYILYSMPQRTLVFRGISFFWISFCWMSGVSTYIECMNVIDMYYVYIYTWLEKI